MIAAAPLVVALLSVVSAMFVRRMPNRMRARTVSTTIAAISVSFLALIWWLHRVLEAQVHRVDEHVHLLPDGLLTFAPFMAAMITLIAVGLAPLATHDSRTFSSILLLAAHSQAFLAIPLPSVLPFLWIGSAMVGWLELRRRSGGTRWARLFGMYQGLSGALFAAGGVAVALGGGTKLAVVLVLLGVAIREGVIPFHSWFPRMVERAPLGLVVAFAGPQLGVYARLEVFDKAWLDPLGAEVAWVGAVTAVTAALLGVVQIHARRAIAFLIVSQTGLIAFGLESHSDVGRAGAILNWQVLALATSALTMTIAALEARRGRLTMDTPNGNFARMPHLATAFLVLGFASVGFPLTLGFVAEDLLVQGTVDEFPHLGIALVLATAFNGITVMRSFLYLFTGARMHEGERDLTTRERLIVGWTMATLFALGAAPGLVLRHP